MGLERKSRPGFNSPRREMWAGLLSLADDNLVLGLEGREREKAFAVHAMDHETGFIIG